MKIKCVCCGKQAVSGSVSIDDKYMTTLDGARAALVPWECYCGHCAKDMDEDGLFPEERAMLMQSDLVIDLYYEER